MSSPFISIQNIYKSFQTGEKTIDVLRDVSVNIEAGEMVAILGASGAGKSTLLHLMGTLDSPTSGSIIINNTSLSSLSDAQLARFRNETIGFMFQFHHLLPEFSALENVAMPALIHGYSKIDAYKRSLELLNKVGLSARLSHRPGQLSGGEQQRVALARALVMNPILLLADEPTGNLDTQTSEEIHHLMIHMNKEYKTTLVIVTHNQALADQLPRRLYMKDGRFLEETQA